MPKYLQFQTDQLAQSAKVRILDPIEHTREIMWQNEIIATFNAPTIEPEHPVIFQRPITKNTINLIKQCYNNGVTTLLEYDDPIWNKVIWETNRKPHKRELEVAHDNLELMKHWCSGIVVSTKGIAEELKKITDKPVIIMPNAVNYGVIPDETRSNVILYTGAGNRESDISQSWKEAIEEMKKRGYKVIGTSKTICDEVLPNMRYHDFQNTIMNLKPDYYIAPLADTYLNRCKSNLKELEAWKIGAKFVGQGTPYLSSIPYDANCETILKAFDNAEVPSFGERYNLNSEAYANMFVTAYSGDWRLK